AASAQEPEADGLNTSSPGSAIYRQPEGILASQNKAVLVATAARAAFAFGFGDRQIAKKSRRATPAPDIARAAKLGRSIAGLSRAIALHIQHRFRPGLCFIKLWTN